MLRRERSGHGASHKSDELACCRTVPFRSGRVHHGPAEDIEHERIERPPAEQEQGGMPPGPGRLAWQSIRPTRTSGSVRHRRRAPAGGTAQERMVTTARVSRRKLSGEIPGRRAFRPISRFESDRPGFVTRPVYFLRVRTPCPRRTSAVSIARSHNSPKLHPSFAAALGTRL